MFEQFVSDQQKRWDEATSHKFEGYESFHSVHKLQDYMCIIDLKDAYFSVYLHRFTKISTASLGRELVRVPVSMVWFGISSQNIHKIIKGSNLSFETSYCKRHNLSRRLIDFGQQYEQNVYDKGLCDLPIATYRLCDKSEETCIRPWTSIRGITSGFDKTNRNPFFNNLSSAPSQSAVSLLTTTTNCIYEANTVLAQFIKVDSHGKVRVVMVGQ